jgi:hypothetical protein
MGSCSAIYAGQRPRNPACVQVRGSVPAWRPMARKNIVICIPCLLLGGSEGATLSMVKALKQSDHDITLCCYYEHEAAMVTRFERAGAKVVLLGMTRGSLRHLLSALVDLFRSQQPTPDALQTRDRAPCRRSLRVC